MQRPIMNPVFLEHEVEPPPRRRLSLLSVMRFLAAVLLWDLTSLRRGPRLQIEDGSAGGRIIKGMLYRLLFVPVLLAGLVGALVWVGTHPPRIHSSRDPLSLGIYYDPVSFLSSDGTRLEGWLVPPVDARKVLEQKEKAVGRRYPATVLLHDYAAGRMQMLPLVRPLHEAGYVVLVVALRGSSSSNSAGSTFGLREAGDVAAAVDLLKRRPGVDANRIALIGVGTGANAAILAAQQEPSVAALVVDRPVSGIDQVIEQIILPPNPYLDWMKPACKWTFEIAYRVNSEDLSPTRRAALESKPSLVFARDATTSHLFHGRGITQMKEFLARHLPDPEPVPTAKLFGQ